MVRKGIDYHVAFAHARRPKGLSEPFNTFGVERFIDWPRRDEHAANILNGHAEKSAEELQFFQRNKVIFAANGKPLEVSERFNVLGTNPGFIHRLPDGS